MKPDRLTRIRGVRELQERVLRAEWAAAERIASAAHATVEGLVTAEADAREALAHCLEERTLDAKQVLLDQLALDGIGRALAQARTYARDAQQIADQKRAPWTERRADAEAMRRLEERHSTLARMAANKREQAVQDEGAGVRHQRWIAEQRELEAEPRASGATHDCERTSYEQRSERTLTNEDTRS